MKIAVFGTTGQVATELARRAPEGVTLTAIGRDRADFSDPAAPVRALDGLDADAVINAVAYTAVDKAESEAELAQTVNGDAVGALARALAERATPFLHVSTDYVFSGAGTLPHKPDDPTGPLGVYGASKLAGEQMIRQAGGPHAILRTSWVFSAHGANFVKTMLRLGAERDRLTIVADQVGGPTPAAAIADALFTMARAMAGGAKGGTFHFSGAPDTTWADFARAIFEDADLSPEVADIPTADYPTPARRPLNSRLDCGTLKEAFGIERPDWRQGLRDVLKEIT
ncbi:dTDP-4-dehydrorhamnose reductase [Alphaproteobacteria bacterium GH1-50]|uniref:dTDP-4-dehydrorhamnose reductase n=1 Tax=Kangsaoukella pontilimi TaxID=2691042 RepID=A0A7C9IQJ8_9RHOB|nr:dTDP-4-dehydrorhamnose reductase [Kangsaoukella pontilimi]MXQ06426.1 dTDP-4-dehydrorhamnose reductase [Kangsaoukella pontilimi]